MAARIVVFIGGKGGSGTTTLAIGLARALKDHRRIALVDADLSGRRSMALLLDARAELDAARGASQIARADVDGLTICELAERYDTAFTLDISSVDGLADSLDDYDIVIADVPQPFAAAIRPFISRARALIVVTEPTLLGVGGSRTLVNDLIRFGVPANRISIVTNARGEREELARNEIERVLESPVVVQVPSNSSRAFGNALGALAKFVSGLPATAEKPQLAPSAKTLVSERRHEPRRLAFNISGNGKPRDVQERAEDEQRETIKREIHEALLQRVDLVAASRAHTDAAKLAELRAKIEEIASEILSGHGELGAEDIARLRQEVLNEELGFGPLESFMGDPDITEIMVNGPNKIYIERAGKIQKTSRRFVNEDQLRLVIERIVAPLGRRIDEASPMVDARLKDGSRVNAIIEPLAIDGATLTIRRFGKKRLDAQALIELNSVTQPVLDLLRAAVEARLNIVVSGGTGSGKTTFLNILSSYLPSRERIVTIEDAAELLLNQEHVVRLESRPPNVEGKGQVTIRDLLRNSLRMRPDRIIIGECRGAEALDMLQAMNTGHDGSITTIHANSPRDSLSRIETMVLMAGFDLPVRAIREQIASAIDMVIHTARLRDGTRKVMNVTEIVGMEGDIVTMQEIVRFAQHGVDKEGHVVGEFQYSGVQPVCLTRFEEYGVTYDARSLSTLAPARASW